MFNLSDLSEELINVTKQILENDRKFQEFFKKSLKKFGYKSLSDIPNEKEKRQFFLYIDKNYQAKNENKETVEVELVSDSDDNFESNKTSHMSHYETTKNFNLTLHEEEIDVDDSGKVASEEPNSAVGHRDGMMTPKHVDVIHDIEMIAGTKTENYRLLLQFPDGSTELYPNISIPGTNTIEELIDMSSHIFGGYEATLLALNIPSERIEHSGISLQELNVKELRTKLKIDMVNFIKSYNVKPSQIKIGEFFSIYGAYRQAVQGSIGPNVTQHKFLKTIKKDEELYKYLKTLSDNQIETVFKQIVANKIQETLTEKNHIFPPRFKMEKLDTDNLPVKYVEKEPSGRMKVTMFKNIKDFDSKVKSGYVGPMADKDSKGKYIIRFESSSAYKSLSQ